MSPIMAGTDANMKAAAALHLSLLARTVATARTDRSPWHQGVGRGRPTACRARRSRIGRAHGVAHSAGMDAQRDRQDGCWCAPESACLGLRWLMRSIESLHGQDLPPVGGRIPRWNPRSTDVPALARRWGCDVGTAGGHPGGVVPGCRRATAPDADAPRPWRRRRSAAQAGGSMMAVAASLARAPGTARALSSAGTRNRWPAAAGPARRSPRIAKIAFQPG